MPAVFIAGFLLLWWWVGFIWAAVITSVIGVCLHDIRALPVIAMFLVLGTLAWAFIGGGVSAVFDLLAAFF